MRITFILPFAGTAGGTRVVAIYADRLRKRGHEVVVVSTPKRDPGFRAKLRSLLKGSGWPKLLGPSHFDHVDVDHRIIDSYRPMTDSDVPDADVVIATWWETAEWVAKLGPSKGAKAYFIQHDETQLSADKDRVIATWRLPMRKVAVAQWLVDLGKSRCNADPENKGDVALFRGEDPNGVAEDPNGVAADPNGVAVRFHPAGTRSENGLRPRFGQITLVPNAVDLDQFNAPPRGKQHDPTVGVMYSQARFKGCDIALKAFEIAQRQTPGLVLVSFGTQTPNASLPLPKMARYDQDPPQNDIRTTYADCDAWLFASRSEGFGLPILEAMACRTPVIATPAGAAPELLAPGGGILVPPEDPHAMADAILKVCAMDDASWRGMSEIAHRTVSSYTWDDATIRFERFLKSL